MGESVDSIIQRHSRGIQVTEAQRKMYKYGFKFVLMIVGVAMLFSLCVIAYGVTFYNFYVYSKCEKGKCWIMYKKYFRVVAGIHIALMVVYSWMYFHLILKPLNIEHVRR